MALSIGCMVLIGNYGMKFNTARYRFSLEKSLGNENPERFIDKVIFDASLYAGICALILFGISIYIQKNFSFKAVKNIVKANIALSIILVALTMLTLANVRFAPFYPTITIWWILCLIMVVTGTIGRKKLDRIIVNQDGVEKSVYDDDGEIEIIED